MTTVHRIDSCLCVEQFPAAYGRSRFGCYVQGRPAVHQIYAVYGCFALQQRLQGTAKAALNGCVVKRQPASTVACVHVRLVLHQ